jgi:hypothetical protein
MKNPRKGAGRWLTAALAFLALAASGTAQAQVKLQYKFPEGQKLTYKSTSNTSQTLTLMGQAIETESKDTILTSQTVGKKRADSTQPVVEKIESLTSELSLPGGLTVSFDSKDPDAKIDNPQLAFLGDVYKLISQMTYTVVLDGQNKVKAVEGTESLIEKADKLGDLAKQSVRSRLNAQHLKEQFEERHGNLPDVLARAGEPWERTEKLDLGGQTLTFHKKYEYAGTEKLGTKTLDKISVKTLDVKYAMDPNSASPLKATKSDLKIESGDGTILFDRDAGAVVSAKGKIHIKGPMTLDAGGQEIAAKLDLTMETDTELQPPAK